MYVAKGYLTKYIYVQVARYLGYACIQQKYLKKIYTCLGSKITHGKKGKKKTKQKQTRKRNKQIKKNKKKREKKKNKLSS